MPAFSQAEIDYLTSQRLGRLATVDAQGAPQNNPVGVHYNAELDTIDVYGRDLANTRKFRNVQTNPNVAMVVDDLVSTQPWQVRGVEVRGVAEAIHLEQTTDPRFGPEVIRIHPRRVISWGLD
jgi:pyridoxamine 5'-phosphate oxidase family protein